MFKQVVLGPHHTASRTAYCTENSRRYLCSVGDVIRGRANPPPHHPPLPPPPTIPLASTHSPEPILREIHYLQYHIEIFTKSSYTAPLTFPLHSQLPHLTSVSHSESRLCFSLSSCLFKENVQDIFVNTNILIKNITVFRYVCLV